MTKFLIFLTPSLYTSNLISPKLISRSLNSLSHSKNSLLPQNLSPSVLLLHVPLPPPTFFHTPLCPSPHVCVHPHHFISPPTQHTIPLQQPSCLLTSTSPTFFTSATTHHLLKIIFYLWQPKISHKVKLTAQKSLPIHHAHLSPTNSLVTTRHYSLPTWTSPLLTPFPTTSGPKAPWFYPQFHCNNLRLTMIF